MESNQHPVIDESFHEKRKIHFKVNLKLMIFNGSIVEDGAVFDCVRNSGHPSFSAESSAAPHPGSQKAAQLSEEAELC